MRTGGSASLVILVVAVACLGASAQTTVTTPGGTIGFVPKFSSSSSIIDSSIFESSGNIGLGTNLPSARLTLFGGNGQLGLMDVYPTTQLSNQLVSEIRLVGDPINYPAISRYASIGAANESGVDMNDLVFNTAYAGSVSEKMRINYSGNVGIGTTAPSGRLTIFGGNGQTGMMDIYPTAQLSNQLVSELRFVGDPSNYPAINRYASVGAANEAGVDVNDLVFNTAYAGTVSEKMRIRYNGNVGIGTSSPLYALDVGGYVRTTAGIVFPNGTVQTTAAVGGGGGTITGVTAGTELTGGGTSGNVTLAVDSSVARTNVSPQYFGGVQHFSNTVYAEYGTVFYNNYSNSTDVLEAICRNVGGYCARLSHYGDLYLSGHLYAGSKPFRIDHPLDPANKYLQHIAVESPDMKTVYDGLVVIGADGSAWVQLPDYFEALNRDFRYQLTAIGASAPGLYVAGEVSGNRFLIAGGNPGTKVSWQVPGIRQDAFAKAYPVPVEEIKATPGYLHPELFGQPVVPSTGQGELQCSAPL